MLVARGNQELAKQKTCYRLQKVPDGHSCILAIHIRALQTVYAYSEGMLLIIDNGEKCMPVMTPVPSL